MVTDEAEFQLHQRLEKLYISTRVGKVTWFFDFNFLFSFIVHVNLSLVS